jgi:hypothetical protein
MYSKKSTGAGREKAVSGPKLTLWIYRKRNTRGLQGPVLAESTRPNSMISYFGTLPKENSQWFPSSKGHKGHASSINAFIFSTTTEHTTNA